MCIMNPNYSLENPILGLGTRKTKYIVGAGIMSWTLFSKPHGSYHMNQWWNVKATLTLHWEYIYGLTTVLSLMHILSSRPPWHWFPSYALYSSKLPHEINHTSSCNWLHKGHNTCKLAILEVGNQGVGLQEVVPLGCLTIFSPPPIANPLNPASIVSSP
jgi:hypothetical protein